MSLAFISPTNPVLAVVLLLLSVCLLYGVTYIVTLAVSDAYFRARYTFLMKLHGVLNEQKKQ